MIQESSFDSLPPGEKYHIPPNESHSSHEGQHIENHDVVHHHDVSQVADGAADPFDTSGIIIPEPSSLKDQTHPEQQFSLESSEAAALVGDTSMIDHAHAGNSNLPPMLAQIAAFMSPPLLQNDPTTITSTDDNDFSEFTNHRRGLSGDKYSSYQDLSSHPVAGGGEPILAAAAATCPDTPNLPKLTDPLSPPAFNPHEIQLDCNEAIAGKILGKP